MTDIKELRRLAEAANTRQGNMADPMVFVLASMKANQEYRQAANPSAILSLLDKIDELTNELADKEREITSIHELQAGEDL